MPNGAQRVVLIVIGGLSAQQEYTDFLRFRKRRAAPPPHRANRVTVAWPLYCCRMAVT